MQTMLLRLVAVLFGWGVLLASAVGQGPAVESAEAMVRRVTEEALRVLREDKAISADRERAIAYFETRIAPHFDFERMTGLAVGRAWREASPALRRELAREFQTLLVRTYANALASYTDHTVRFKPARAQARDDEAVVQSQVEASGAAPVPLDYRLYRRDGGEWKVYDVVVNGVSLVTNYRGAFAAEVQRGGIDGLLASLRMRNRNLEVQQP